jgi:hypothetical protein
MKKQLYLWMLLFASLLVMPENTQARKTKALLPISVVITGDILEVSSTGGSGNIRRLQVRQGATVLLSQNCPNTSVCSINISSLSPGNYTVVAYCTNATLEQPFTK